MIQLDPALADHFLVLEHHESFEDYARAYGDAIAEHYENRGVVIVPRMPIQFDRRFFLDLKVPARWKKIGTINGIERPVLGADGQPDTRHPFVAGFGDLELARHAQQEIARFNSQLRRGLALLLDPYRRIFEGNISWRLRETVEEGLHVDVFNRGRPMDPEYKSLHRIKIFINIDDQPRRWRTSLDLPGILARARGLLPRALPDDLNVVNNLIDKFHVLKDAPAHRVDYPTMSAVLVNAELVAHEVLYGHRVIAGEFACARDEMLDPGKHSYACLARWIGNAGYAIDPDAAAVAERHAQMKGSYERLQESRSTGA
jgi:hypothetical protein